MLLLENKKPPVRLRVLISVIAPGFEPGTACLEGRCSIQLSYATKLSRKNRKNVGLLCHLLFLVDNIFRFLIMLFF